MTNSEALKKMQAIKAYMTSGNPIWSITEIGEAFDMAIEALERTEPKWIPCEREFPPNMKYVLVSDGMGVWEDRLSKHDGIWVECATYQSDSYSWAWRELPEPWRGEEHG